jgi:hypothetical protein
VARPHRRSEDNPKAEQKSPHPHNPGWRDSFPDGPGPAPAFCAQLPDVLPQFLNHASLPQNNFDELIRLPTQLF